MALSFAKGVFTAPTVNGTDTVISPGFAPKAIILWTTAQTSAAAIDGHGIWAQGMATYDGAAVQQFYTSYFDTDALGTSDTARGSGTGSLLKGWSAATPTVDFECDLISMDGTSVTIDWADAPAAAILVHYIVLGSSDITGARVGTFNLAITSPQSVTVNAGFGQPDLLILMSRGNVGATGDANGNTGIGVGAAVSDTERAACTFMQADAATTMAVGSWQKARAQLGVSGNTADYEMDLDAKVNWPTDGFQVTIPDLPAAATNPVYYLALKGTFQKKIGTNVAPIVGSPPVVQNNDCGFAPKGVLTFGNNLPSGVAYDITHADLGSHFMGGSDGTNEGIAAVTQDDTNTTSFSGRVHDATKTVRFYKFGVLGTDPPPLQSEADGSFSGNNFSLSWNDIDSVAREYCYVVLGDAAAGGAPGPAFPNRHRSMRALIRR
jgi:hypothetical protein